ncbi:CLUMA_CG015734, isoform A [Clunio marinus]|uniref:CLUMA_CG015734, isoform A n=1 Tax=Clunio marinus TaxID=568069 RepID=A0A1J1IUZ5_9DIPT|nr:CLUMA_CG015734, isoform A [Clunio marinus]
MKLFLFVFVLISVYNVVNGAVGQAAPSKTTDCSSGTCVDYCDNNGKKILPGQQITENCELTKCNKDFSLSFESCSPFRTDKCKRFGPDVKLSYPDCCNKICIDRSG